MGAGRGCQAVLPAFLCRLPAEKGLTGSHPLACEPGICYPPDREEAKAMKPHIVTEDMRLRGPGRAGAGGKAVSAPGWRRLPAGGPGQRLRPPDLQHLPGPGRRDHVQLRGFFGESLPAGTGFLLLQHPRVPPMGIGVHSTAEWTGQSTAPTPLRPVWPTWRTGPPSFRPTPAVLGRSSCCWGGARGP